MFTFLLILQGIICFALIVLVLLHQGKGADAGAAFGSGGGGAHSFFGAAGAADFMTKLTTAVAVAFMACSILLIRAYPSAVGASASTSVAADPVAGSRIAPRAITTESEGSSEEVQVGSIVPENVEEDTAANTVDNTEETAETVDMAEEQTAAEETSATPMQ